MAQIGARSGPVRMAKGWKSKQPARSTRSRNPRQQFELTVDEWTRLGGTRRPEVATGPLKAGAEVRWFTHDAPTPAVMPDAYLIFSEVAERLGLHTLTIAWPDAHELAITAEAL